MAKRKELLEKYYKILDLDFKIDNTETLCLYLYDFHKDIFMTSHLQIQTQRTGTGTNYFVSPYTWPNTGIKEKMYSFGLYEALLWYNYYKYPRRQVLKYRFNRETKQNEGIKCKNKSYHSVIPKAYRTMDSKKGLNVIKQVIDQIIIDNHGFPEYFDPECLKTLFIVK